MDKIWVLPICIAIISYFGIFWTLNLSDIVVDIKMDNNTLEAMISIDWKFMDNLNKEIICFIPWEVFDSNKTYKVIIGSDGDCVF